MTKLTARSAEQAKALRAQRYARRQACAQLKARRPL